MPQTAVTVDSSITATQGAKSTLANEPDEIIDFDEGETGNDVDLDDDD